MLGSGNYLLDRMEAEDCPTRKCQECNGLGSISWKNANNWIAVMGEAIHAQILKTEKGIGRKLSFGEAVRLARIVRSDGQECFECEGLGEK